VVAAAAAAVEELEDQQVAGQAPNLQQTGKLREVEAEDV
jgi:hypothetical protein